jgi:hypothetical protein
MTQPTRTAAGWGELPVSAKPRAETDPRELRETPNLKAPAGSRGSPPWRARRSPRGFGVGCRITVLTAALLAGFSPSAATLPADWQHEQPFRVPTAGLVKLSLPVETLDAARVGLEDLRLYDDAGNEVPYRIERPVPTGKTSQLARPFQVTLNATSTVLFLEHKLPVPIEGITLECQALDFMKPVRIEGSADGANWQTLVEGQPIFRQPNGARRLYVEIPPGIWPRLRVTVDDHRSPPIPFTGARVHAATSEPTPGELLTVPIIDRHENPGETRLTLNLGAANLNLASVQLETPEPLFTRQVTLAAPLMLEDSVREQTLAQSFIYRVAVEGQPASANLTVPLGNLVRTRELLLFIKNQDSPPLPVTAVRAERRPVYLVFLAKEPGAYHLLVGNSRCPAPEYDLAGLNMDLKALPVAAIQLPSPADCPGYRPPEVLPGVEENSTALDVAAWRFRKPVKLTRSGAQQMELDLDVLAHAQPGFQDLRLMRGGNQVPYIQEHTSISRALTPTATATTDERDPKLSRWVLKLSRPALPVTRLACATPTALFQRSMLLYEEVADERGEKFRRTVGQGSWVQTPNRPARQFVLNLDGPLQTDTLYLETQNGDNPPVELKDFQLFYPVTRLLFKAKAGGGLFLYYGNVRALSPSYDLGLVADQLVTADKATALLGGEEQLQKSSWRDGLTPGKGGVLFWGILALVVVVLLVIISRLLPRTPPPSGSG